MFKFFLQPKFNTYPLLPPPASLPRPRRRSYVYAFYLEKSGNHKATFDMQQSQHSLSMSVQLQLNNIPLIGPLDAAAVTSRIGSSMFSDIEQQRIATVIANKVGHHAVPSARVQSLSKPLNYLSCFALAAVHSPSPHL